MTEFAYSKVCACPHSSCNKVADLCVLKWYVNHLGWCISLSWGFSDQRFCWVRWVMKFTFQKKNVKSTSIWWYQIRSLRTYPWPIQIILYSWSSHVHVLPGSNMKTGSMCLGPIWSLQSSRVCIWLLRFRLKSLSLFLGVLWLCHCSPLCWGVLLLSLFFY
jgi:hypothetical protein